MDKNKILYYQENNELYLIFFDHIMAANIIVLFNIIEKDIQNKTIKKIFIDFYKCNYIDSTVIGTLIKIQTLLKNKDLILYNLNKEILKIFSHMGLEKFFTIKQNLIDLKDIKKYSVLESIDNNLDPEFVLDAHNHIIKVSPSIRGEFETLISVLKSQIKK